MREVKATSVLPPAPFDRLAWFECSDPPPGFEARPLPVQPDYWRDIGSTLRIETGAGRPEVHQAVDASGVEVRILDRKFGRRGQRPAGTR